MTQSENPQRSPEEVREYVKETLERAASARQILESDTIIHLDAGALQLLFQQLEAGENLQNLLNQCQNPPPGQ